MSISKKPPKLISLITLIIIIFVLSAVSNQFNDIGQKTSSINPGYYTVDRFVDGDTISVNMNGKSEKIRFIGVDTPETHKPNTPVQCYGPAAAAFTKNTIGKQKVRLEADSLSTNRDKYGRLLRYIYLSDGTNVNAKIISTGNGFYYPYFPFEKKQEFAKLQNQAKSGNKGLWGNCAPTQNSRGGYTSNPM